MMIGRGVVRMMVMVVVVKVGWFVGWLVSNMALHNQTRNRNTWGAMLRCGRKLDVLRVELNVLWFGCELKVE